MPQTERFDDTHFLSLGGSTKAIKPGDIVGGTYILKSLLGQGGMGYVFLAEHSIIKKDYALKIVRPDRMDDFSWQRFEIEGRVIAKLDHPNIVKIYNMGVDQGNCPFYVMDLLPGEPLSEYINRGAGLTFGQCLDIFRQVAEGLAYAHRKGIIHRDVKPANIILLKENEEDEEDHDGGFQAKIVDFGLAKIINRSASSSQPQAITAQGQIFGSPYYMSPEQCQGQAVDHRSDIYSLGCALYESIAGEPPFVGTNAVQTLMMHTESAMPKLADRFSEQPAIAVDSLIAKMTAKEPNDRYQSMDEVAAALGRLQKRAPSLSFNLRPSENSDRSASDDSSIVQSSLHTRADAKWLLAGSILVVLSIVFVVAYFYSDKNWGEPMVATLPPDAEAILNFGPIKSRLVSGTDYKEFRFPEIPIGAVVDLGTGISQKASGSTLFKSTNFLDLTVDEQEVPLVFDYPQVFGQIGKDEFHGLFLKAKADAFTSGGSQGHGPELSFNGLARSERIAYSQKQLTAILKIVSSWTKLCALVLDGFAVNDQVFQVIEKLPHMTTLTLKKADFLMKELAQQKFLDRLTELKILEPDYSTVDALLCRLAESPNLISLELDSVEFLPESFCQLKRCPKLTELTLNNSEVTDDVIEAILQLENLEVFGLRGVKMTDSQIAALAKLKHLHVTLAASDYAAEEKLFNPELLRAYRKKFPTIAFE